MVFKKCQYRYAIPGKFVEEVIPKLSDLCHSGRPAGVKNLLIESQLVFQDVIQDVEHRFFGRTSLRMTVSGILYI